MEASAGATTSSPINAKTFRLLAVKEALGTLTAEEATELERMTIVRRNEESPRTGEEVLHEHRQRQLTNDLLKALRRFVDFYDGGHG